MYILQPSFFVFPSRFLKRCLWVAATTIGCLLSGFLPAQAGNGLPLADDFISLPVKPTQQTDTKKLQLADGLTAWVLKTLEENHAQVGVIARQGPPLTRLVDPSGMTHVALIFQHPQTHEWMTYSLYSNLADHQQTAQLWRQSPEDFFYGQRTDKKEALLLIPSPALQMKMLRRLYAQPFHSLLPPDHHYNLIAPIGDLRSFNCTKWLVLNLYAAALNTEDEAFLLDRMNREFPARGVKPNLLVRYFLKRKQDVRWEELSPPNTVRTITVDSLYHSPLFERRFLFSGKPAL